MYISIFNMFNHTSVLPLVKELNTISCFIIVTCLSYSISLFQMTDSFNSSFHQLPTKLLWNFPDILKRKFKNCMFCHNRAESCLEHAQRFLSDLCSIHDQGKNNECSVQQPWIKYGNEYDNSWKIESMLCKWEFPKFPCK